MNGEIQENMLKRLIPIKQGFHQVFTISDLKRVIESKHKRLYSVGKSTDYCEKYAE